MTRCNRYLAILTSVALVLALGCVPNKQYQQKQSENEILKGQLTNASTERDQATKNLENLKSDLAKANSDLTTARAALTEVTRQLDASRTAVQADTQAKTKLQRDLASASEQNQAITNQLQAAKIRLTDLEKKITQLNTQLDSARKTPPLPPPTTAPMP